MHGVEAGGTKPRTPPPSFESATQNTRIYLSAVRTTMSSNAVDETMRRLGINGTWANPKFAHTATHPGELSLSASTWIHNVQKINSMWCSGNFHSGTTLGPVVHFRRQLVLLTFTSTHGTPAQLRCSVDVFIEGIYERITLQKGKKSHGQGGVSANVALGCSNLSKW